jgi:hypothetical protein
VELHIRSFGPAILAGVIEFTEDFKPEGWADCPSVGSFNYLVYMLPARIYKQLLVFGIREPYRV